MTTYVCHEIAFSRKKKIEKGTAVCSACLIDDADSSQHSDLIDAVDGKNLVIEGPPGTGKSQTITNLIAAAMAQGKKVLFVAEGTVNFTLNRSDCRYERCQALIPWIPISSDNRQSRRLALPSFLPELSGRGRPSGRTWNFGLV